MLRAAAPEVVQGADTEGVVHQAVGLPPQQVAPPLVIGDLGSNRRYFNACGTYPSLGAAQSYESPYISWYSFQEWPVRYDSWWGIHTLPWMPRSLAFLHRRRKSSSVPSMGSTLS